MGPRDTAASSRETERNRMVRHVASIAEIVEDVDAAVRFYRDVLGFEVKRDAGAPYALVHVPGILHFGIWERTAAAESVYGDPAQAHRVPLGFSVAVRGRRGPRGRRALAGRRGERPPPAAAGAVGPDDRSAALAGRRRPRGRRDALGAHRRIRRRGRRRERLGSSVRRSWIARARCRGPEVEDGERRVVLLEPLVSASRDGPRARASGSTRGRGRSDTGPRRRPRGSGRRRTPRGAASGGRPAPPTACSPAPRA